MGINRYPGPKPFKKEEKSLFFGRETDISEFYKYIFLHQIVTLFGASGYGKSSLINAGIVPLLAAKNPNTVCFEVKFGPYVSGSDRNTPIQKIREVISNLPTQNSPFSIETYLEPDHSFWHYLKNFQLAYEAQQVIFFFDQFEELFTYPENLILEFKKELADVLYSTVPEFYRNQEDLLDEDHVSEEFRMVFYNKPDVKVVFSIRSDRLGLLEDIKDFHPSALKNCYELKALDIPGALEAIRKPAALPNEPEGIFKTAPFEIEEKLCLAIVNALKDKNERIQTSTLQIICWQIEDKFVPLIDLKKENKTFVANYKLTFEEFDENDNGNIKEEIEGIFNNYYRTTIETKIPETLRNAAFLLVEKVLVQTGQRIPFEKEYLLTEFLMKQFKVPNRADAQLVLDTLTEVSLLKVEQDSQRRMMYELGHDTLVEPITKAANLRREKEDQQRLSEETEQAKGAALIAKKNEEIATQQAKQFKKLKEEAEVAKLEAESYAQKAVHEGKKAVLRSRIAIVISLMACATAYYAYTLKTKADDYAVKAETSQKLAEKNSRAYFMQQARGYIEKGDELFNRKAYLAALDYYEAALKLPHRYDPLIKQLNTKINTCKTAISQ